MAGDVVKFAVICLLIDTPETGTAHIGETRTEAVAQQTEQSEDDIAVGTGVGHDLGRLRSGLLFEHDRQKNQTVAQGAGSDDRVESGELVGEQVVPGDALELPEVFGVGAGMDGANRHHETHPVGGSDLAATPSMRQCGLGLRRNQPGIGGRQGVVADVVLFDPGEAIAAAAPGSRNG